MYIKQDAINIRKYPATMGIDQGQEVADVRVEIVKPGRALDFQYFYFENFPSLNPCAHALYVRKVR